MSDLINIKMLDIIVKALNIHKSFDLPDKSKLNVLNNLDLEIYKGEIVAVTGISGSGKSTLLHVLATLDTFDKGEVWYNNLSINSLNRKEQAKLRNKEFGFVYQFHYLIEELTIIENVVLPALIGGEKMSSSLKRAEDLLKRVNLWDKKDALPLEISGGERQRAAIARSLINNPKILFADEPTGNLDIKTGDLVFSMLKDMVKETGLTALIVTHNVSLANQANRSFSLLNGNLK